jgi:hypothetical protein
MKSNFELISFNETEQNLVLSQLISGGQTGADQAGLFIGEKYGMKTGGTAPQGFKTLVGFNPTLLRDRFHLVESLSPSYKIRTWANVRNSDATIRLATSFESPGEICTKNACVKYDKLVFDVDLKREKEEEYIAKTIDDFINFLSINQIQILNVAGNADRFPRNGFGNHFNSAFSFLDRAFSKLYS